VTQRPETRYTKSGNVHIAYQVLGSGPTDLIVVPPALLAHIESVWEEPSVARFYRRLASFSRLMIFDKRGTGMSDRVACLPTVEERMDDIRCVMEAVHSQRAALCGLSEGGAIAALFAATYPNVATSVVAIGSGAGGYIPDPATQRRINAYVEQHWGEGLSFMLGAPSVGDDEHLRRWFGKLERVEASPGAVVELMKANAAFDIRAVLPTISSPTLVIHRTGDLTFALAEGRFMAEQIPGARFVELPGTDHLPYWEDADIILDLIEKFVTGECRATASNRVLATTLFTDIVNSTLRASTVGDRRWRETLDQYDGLVEAELDRFRGRLVKTTGDGTLATFDGPARAIQCACAVREASQQLDLEIRAGVHTGEIELRGDDVTGLGVVIAQRVSALATSGEVLVSRTVKDLVVGSGIDFSDRGEHELKGVPGTWGLFSVVD